jgi:phosphoribosylformylglycinamidine (FGAM) synthase PurS component
VNFLDIPIAAVRVSDVYKIEADLSDDEARRVLCRVRRPVCQHGALGRPRRCSCTSYVVGCRLQAGVTDPGREIARVCVEDTLGRKLAEDAASTRATLYCLDGVDVRQRGRIATELLANPVIQTIRIETTSAGDGRTSIFPSRRSRLTSPAGRDRRSVRLGRSAARPSRSRSSWPSRSPR